MATFEFRAPMKVRPRLRRCGQISYKLSAALIKKQDEIALGISFISDRQLFGLSYSFTQPAYFDQMPRESGVFICPFVPTKYIAANAVRPGDIDLLIIPYENEELILHRVMAIELKALRATFVKQGKSPNQFGNRQASALLKLGFPYVSIAHLIISDQSPKTHWREVAVAQTIDGRGTLKPLPNQKIDMMPADLIDRAFGRLQHHNMLSEVGLICAYLDWNSHPDKRSIWHPECRPAFLNSNVSRAMLEAILDFYYDNFQAFLDNPRYDRE